jgi:hypothetical protein
MTELINKLVAGAGLSAQQAEQSLEIIKTFVKEKFPMLSGAVDNVFGAQVDDVAAAAGLESDPAQAASAAPQSWLDKISEVIPGEIGEKIEDFAKNAAVAAEDLLEKGKAKFDELEKKLG